MYNKGIKIRQQDITDCGAASLASVCAHYGLKFPIARIRQYAFTDKKGTNVLGMVEAAGKLGLSAKGVRAQPEALKIIPLPAIAHVVVKEILHHFVVIYKVTDKYIEYMDPGDGGMHQVVWEEFQRIWTGVLILLEPKETFVRGDMKTSIVRRFFQLLRPHKSVMVEVLFGAVICSILGLSTSVYVGKIVDYVLVDENVNLLNLMGVAMVAIILIRIFISTTKSILALKTSQMIDATLILGYYKHILHLPQQFFDTMRVGEIISRVNDAVKIRMFINNVSVDLVVNVLILVFSTGVMFAYSWKLALVTLISAPLFLVVFFLFNRLNKKYQREIMETAADLEAQLVESLNAITTIKRFGIEEHANLKTEARFVRLLRNTYVSARGSIFAGNGIDLISSAVTVAVLWVGSKLVIDQTLTPGSLMIFYSLIGYVLSPIGSLITSNQTIQDALIAADRLFQILDLETEDSDETNKVNLAPEMIDNITFESVSFRYGSRKQVFESLSLTIPKGRTTAIVGESGSGKTTLISLLQRIYPIQSGHIYIGKYDIAMVSNDSLRRVIGTVPQKVELFAGTLLSNICLGDLQPDMRRVLDIIEQLGLRDFIDGLPRGLDTIISEQGTTLSGGERQRISIARALYKQPEILIFDEATSSLDSISERFVKQTLNTLAAKGKTIIVIAHRLSTIKDANMIVVIDKGMVAESGTHGELIAQNGVFQRLWREQFNVID